VERQGAPLTHPASSGGWVQGARGRAGWVDQGGDGVMGQVLGGGEMSSERTKHAFVFVFLFAFGRLVGDTVIPGGLVCEIGRPDL
jgi:hypothetical protein